jgi:hypothetical protein
MIGAGLVFILGRGSVVAVSDLAGRVQLDGRDPDSIRSGGRGRQMPHSERHSAGRSRISPLPISPRSRWFMMFERRQRLGFRLRSKLPQDLSQYLNARRPGRYRCRMMVDGRLNVDLLSGADSRVDDAGPMVTIASVDRSGSSPRLLGLKRRFSCFAQRFGWALAAHHGTYRHGIGAKRDRAARHMISHNNGRAYHRDGSLLTHCWRKADSNSWSHLERDQPFRGCHLGFRARLHRMRVIPERDKFEPLAFQDNLGSRSWGRLSVPSYGSSTTNVTDEALQTGTWDGKAEREDGTGHRVDGRGRPARGSQLGQAGARVLVHGAMPREALPWSPRSRPAAERRRSLPPTEEVRR